MQPIKKRMLVNEATYKEYVSDSGEGSTYKDEITLGRIKIDEQKRFSYTSNGKEVIGNAIMFYDLVNSTGLTSEPVNESIITFNGKTYTIKDTDILRANNSTPHHYEVLLK